MGYPAHQSLSDKCKHVRNLPLLYLLHGCPKTIQPCSLSLCFKHPAKLWRNLESLTKNTKDRPTMNLWSKETQGTPQISWFVTVFDFKLSILRVLPWYIPISQSWWLTWITRITCSAAGTFGQRRGDSRGVHAGSLLGFWYSGDSADSADHIMYIEFVLWLWYYFNIFHVFHVKPMISLALGGSSHES